MSGTSWFLHRDGQQYGPFTWEQVVELARTDRIAPHDLLWRAGETESRRAADVPGLLPPEALAPQTPGTPRRRWLIPTMVGVVVALVAALVVVLVTNGGDDASSDSRPPAETDATDTTDTTEPETTEPPATTEPETTEPPATTQPEPTAPPTTVATTPAPTAPPVKRATVEDLVAALPASDEIPPSWAWSEGPSTDLRATEGPKSGTCGLANNHARALSMGLVAYAGDEEVVLPDDGFLYLSLFAFSSPERAQEFIDLTIEQSTACPAGYEFDALEGDGPDDLDYFTDYGDGFVTWHVLETQDVQMMEGPDEPRLVRTTTAEITTFTDGIAYAARWTEVDVFERWGSVVFLVELYGDWGIEGFSSWESPLYQPVPEVAVASADEIRSVVLGELIVRGIV